MAWAGVLLVVFVATAYFSFSGFVRRGEVTLPSVVGLSIAEARSQLSDLEVTVRHRADQDRFDDEVVPGAIVRQSPRVGTPVKRGRVVEVSLSRGRERVVVPDLVDQPMQTVVVNLKAAGLTLGRSLQVYTDGGTEGRVVRQEPVAGSEVDPLSTVDLFVRLPEASESFVMPDLIYREYETVRRFFDARGFRVGSVKFEAYEGAAPGAVLRQFPLPGHRLGRQDVISLVVAGHDRDQSNRPESAGEGLRERRLQIDGAPLAVTLATEASR